MKYRDSTCSYRKLFHYTPQKRHMQPRIPHATRGVWLPARFHLAGSQTPIARHSLASGTNHPCFRNKNKGILEKCKNRMRIVQSLVESRCLNASKHYPSLTNFSYFGITVDWKRLTPTQEANFVWHGKINTKS